MNLSPCVFSKWKLFPIKRPKLRIFIKNPCVVFFFFYGTFCIHRVSFHFSFWTRYGHGISFIFYIFVVLKSVLMTVSFFSRWSNRASKMKNVRARFSVRVMDGCARRARESCFYFFNLVPSSHMREKAPGNEVLTCCHLKNYSRVYFF